MVHIPRTHTGATKTHTGPNFAKLLIRVDAEASSGFGFEGTLLKRGACIDEQSLWPTPAHPKTPIVLECAGSIGVTASGARARGHHRAQMLYVLWRYLEGKWTELGRAVSDSWTWALDLRPLALRALAEQQSAELLPSLDAVTVRISTLLSEELGRLEKRDRGFVLGVLHDQFAWRIAALL